MCLDQVKYSARRLGYKRTWWSVCQLSPLVFMRNRSFGSTLTQTSTNCCQAHTHAHTEEEGEAEASLAMMRTRSCHCLSIPCMSPTARNKLVTAFRATLPGLPAMHWAPFGSPCSPLGICECACHKGTDTHEAMDQLLA